MRQQHMAKRAGVREYVADTITPRLWLHAENYAAHGGVRFSRMRFLGKDGEKRGIDV